MIYDWSKPFLSFFRNKVIIRNYNISDCFDIQNVKKKKKKKKKKTKKKKKKKNLIW